LRGAARSLSQPPARPLASASGLLHHTSHVSLMPRGLAGCLTTTMSHRGGQDHDDVTLSWCVGLSGRCAGRPDTPPSACLREIFANSCRRKRLSYLGAAEQICAGAEPSGRSRSLVIEIGEAWVCESPDDVGGYPP